MTASQIQDARELRDRITPKHVERGRLMRTIVQNDIVRAGMSYEQAVDHLAAELDVEPATVKLAIAIANDADREAL